MKQWIREYRFVAGPKGKEGFKIESEGVSRPLHISFKLEKPLSQIALNWLVNKKEMGPVICGAQKPEHILENISSLDWDLTQENEEEIEFVINKYNEKGLF